MARRKRGVGARGGTTTTRKTRSSTNNNPVPATQTENVISPSESEESSSSVSTQQQSSTTAIHKKFGKFRCLHIEENMKSEVSGSDSEIAIEVVAVDPNQSSAESEVCDKNEEPQMLYNTIPEEMILEDLVEEETVIIAEESINHCDIEESLRKISVNDYQETEPYIQVDDEYVPISEETVQCTEIDQTETVQIVHEITEPIESEIIQTEPEIVHAEPEIIQTEPEIAQSESIQTELETTDVEMNESPIENSEKAEIFEEDSVIGEENSDKVTTAGTESPFSEINLSSTDTTNDSVNSGESSVPAIVKPPIVSQTQTVVNGNKESSDSPTENVRRSSRIRNISELKLKTKGPKGRGLVQTKAMLKQGMNEVALPNAPSPPVKVKQRWRRSSELEAAREDPEMEQRLRQFTNIKENLYLTERLTSKEAKRMTCDCFLTKEEIERGEYGCGEDCLNRLLMIECGNHCVVGDRCTNKRFQNLKYAQCEVFRTDKKGFGIRAIKEIPNGEFIMEYVGEVVNQNEFEKRAEVYSADKNIHYYFMSLRADAVIDATQKGNVSRFINHSCDPNAETQKWTVNGELRIGFFARRDITSLEEITFDYQFQRYGKEAQKCYCESEICRGWIGEEPDDDEDEDEEGDEEEIEERKVEEVEMPIEETSAEGKVITEKKVVKVVKKIAKPLKKRPTRTDIRDDTDLDVEIEKLTTTGIKNRAHTLTLSRLLVRACDAHDKAPRLLNLLRNAELPCRRLFLDYHGLRLLHTWMTHEGADDSFKVLLLETLASLPISNKTMLQDSKVLNTVQKWSEGCPIVSPNTDSGNSTPEVGGISKQETSTPNGISEPPLPIAIHTAPTEIMSLSLKLLTDWSTLKEVFRIPKKERIEQMKEHEREADRSGQLHKEKTSSSSSTLSERGGNDIQSSRDRYDRYRRKGRENSPPRKSLHQMPQLLNAPPPKLTKHQRRHLFAMQVAQEEEEKRRNQQAEAWRNHEQRCLALGIDPRQPFIPTPVWLPPPLPPPIPPPQPPPPIKLPPKWKCAKDNRGRPYYYHTKIRISQWEPPEFNVQPPLPPITESEKIVQEVVDDDGNDSTSSSSEESSTVSETSSSENDSSDEDMEMDDTRLMLEVRQKLKLINPELPLPPMSLDKTIKESPPIQTTKRKREALVQEIIISPRREEDIISSKIEARKYRETKDKLRRRKEAAAAAAAARSKEKRSSVIPIPDIEISSDKEQKIKNNFRKKMANVMVHILGPYKKSDCKIGRITNTDDFKHLAKKLTMFVMLKELKNCRSVFELAVNDSVKTKAREFVKKYMSKYGEIYIRTKEEMKDENDP